MKRGTNLSLETADTERKASDSLPKCFGRQLTSEFEGMQQRIDAAVRGTADVMAQVTASEAENHAVQREIDAVARNIDIALASAHASRIELHALKPRVIDRERE